ncbi:MAG: peroxide stress protein YaaA [Cellulosilyticum sp.]|nr:peroxide stress protein YaaA [Cellulosilyticum sp.]
MRIIISPAKKMKEDLDTLEYSNVPLFLEKTQRIMEVLKGMDYDALKALWKCNDQIAKLNEERLCHMNLERNLTPAILSYEGIQYQYMAPAVFETEAYHYIEEHLRILSGFYGMLKPFDGVTPYRLEMQAKLSVDGHKNLYAYWGEQIARQLLSETECIVNLASKEYSKCIEPYLTDDIQFVTCVFGEVIDGKVKEKGTYAKMARGEMVRFMAEHQIQKIEEIKAFNRLGYCFEETYSSEKIYTFIK